MNKAAYKQKIEAELELAQAKVAELKARAKLKVADTRIDYDQQIREIEKRADLVRAKLKELGHASEEAWGSLREGVETSWAAMSSAVKDAISKFKD